MFPKLTSNQLAQAKKENAPISYSVAIKRQPKEGNFIPLTPVKWDAKTPKQYREVSLDTIGKVRILLTPELPKGYDMICHPSENKLLLSIFDGRKTYTPEQMDLIQKDLNFLRKEKLVHSWVFDWVSLIVSGEAIPFIGDYKNHNWVAYDNHRNELSSKWKAILSNCNFFLVHSLTGLGETLLKELDAIYEWKFDADEYFTMNDRDLIEDVRFMNPLRREPTELDERKIRLAFQKIIAARQISLESAMNLLNSEAICIK